MGDSCSYWKSIECNFDQGYPGMKVFHLESICPILENAEILADIN